MLIRLYRGTGPGDILLLFFTACLIWLSAFLHPVNHLALYYDSDPMPLYRLLQMAIGNDPLIGIIFTFSLVILMLFLVTNFNTSHFFINERTFLPSLVYILLVGLFPAYQVLNPVLPASVFLMLSIRLIADSYRKQGISNNFFNAAFLVGTGSLFYANLIWFGVLIFIGIAIFRTGNIKEILTSLIGLVSPLILTAGVYYLAGLDLLPLKDTFLGNLFTRSEYYSFGGIDLAGILIMGFILLAALIYLFSSMNSKKIKSRKTFSTLIWTLVICLVAYFAVPSVSLELIWFAAIPMCYIIANYLIFGRNRVMAEISLGFMFVIILVMQIRVLL